MKYDLSRVPRPLHDQSLKCWCGPSPKCWAVVVGNDDFQTWVAEAHDSSTAYRIVLEVRNVLKAHRLLAGKATFLDTFVPSP